MTTASVALDPGEAIAAAMRDLYDQLREIVDRGPSDDPGLLDELGKLTGRIRSRITRARKRAEPAEEQAAPQTAAGRASCAIPQEAPEPVRTPADSPQSAGDAAPAVAGGDGRAIRTPIAPASPEVTTAPITRADAAIADAPTVPRHRAVPAPRRSEEITVRLPRPGVSGRHRLQPARLPLWMHALVVLLIVAGVALGTAATAWAFAGVPVGAVVATAARRRNVRRQARGGTR